MTVNEQGRHCNSCNKTVIDFSLYTDKELVVFFQNGNKKICGRIHNSQANRPILITAPGKFPFFHKLFWGTALASWLGLINHADAQNNASPAPLEQRDIKTAGKDSTEKHLVNYPVDYYHIKGVTKFGETSLSNITITIKDLKTGNIIAHGITDSAGSFNLTVAKEYYKHRLQLYCSSSSYEATDNILFKLKKMPVFEMNINMRRTYLTGFM